MHSDIFPFELILIFAFASLIGLVMSKLKQPTMVAYILVGIILGPAVLGLISSGELIDKLAHIGVMALLFILGLEFSYEKFKEIRKIALFAGLSQVIFTLSTVFLIFYFFNYNLAQCFLMGSIVALSSTVIVVKTLSELGKLNTVQGRIILGILIMQDLSLIPIMIILPSLSIQSGNIFIPLLFSVSKAVIFLAVFLYVSIKLSPMITNLVAEASKEILILTSISIALVTAMISTYFGISLELGAFIAGLALSITAHSKQLINDVIPFRDIFAMLFFVSIGLLFDLQFFIANIHLILLIVISIFFIKFVINFVIMYFAKYPGQTALWVGLSLFQIGEFSFILEQYGFSQKIISYEIYSLAMTSTLVTMLATPFVIKGIPYLILMLNERSFWKRFFIGKRKLDVTDSNLQNHIIICGCGQIGMNLLRIFGMYSEKVVVIELNSQTVKKLKKQGIMAIYGDASNEHIMEHVNLKYASLLAITVPDVHSNELIINSARKMNSDIPILARARFEGNISDLYEAGASSVVYDEYETSLSFILEAFIKLNYTKQQIDFTSQILRENKFELLKTSYEKEQLQLGRASIIRDSDIDWIRVKSSDTVVGKSILDADIRKLTGASIIGIVRNKINIPNPDPLTSIEGDDILILFGSTGQISKFKILLQGNS